MMLRNYWKIAWRRLLNNKAYSFINITGLAVGMAVAMMIGLWVWDEVSFNSYHHNHKRLADILSIQTFNGEIAADRYASVPLAAELRNKYPDDFRHLALASGNSHALVAGNKKINGWGMWTQAGFPVMFSFKMVQGNQNALQDPSSILLSQSLAETLFGDTGPMHKTVRIDNKTDFNVAGVYEDLPQNTDLSGTLFLMAWDNKDNPGIASQSDWNDHHYQLYVQLNDRTDFEKTNSKIKDITKPHTKGAYEEVRLNPMDKWHLYNEFKDGKPAGGRIEFVWLFSTTGVFVLLLACINFMNLSTAQSEKRAKEVGIRKAAGSLRKQLIAQFLSESFMMALLAFVTAILLVTLFFPLFNTLAGKRIAVPWTNPSFWLAALCFTAFTGFVSGSYPAFYLSGFSPVKVLKGTFKAGRWASLPRKMLVTVQFIVSVALIIGTIVVLRQIQYARDRPVGYDRQRLITVNMIAPEMHNHYDAFRNELLQTGVVENMAESSSSSTNVENSMLGYDWKGRDPTSTPIIGTVFVTHDFGKTIGWQMKEGRDFSRSFSTDSGAFILNEAAAKFIGMKHPVGEVIRWNQTDHPVLGVVRDMVMESPYMPVQPTFFVLSNNKRIHVITIRFKSTTPMHKALAAIGPVFKKYDPDSPFEYKFTDQTYAEKFAAEQHIGNLAGWFALLAIFISCLGLFGLASFIAAQRTKEIGVRKVLGASVFTLWKLLSAEFIMIVILACLVAIPLANYFLHQWLQKYTYRASVTWWIFAAATACALFVTLLTVSYQTIRAAMINPVKSLKTE